MWECRVPCESVEEGGLKRSLGSAEVAVGEFRDFASARCALDESLFDKEGLVYFFYGAGIFSDCCRYCCQTYRSSFEFVDYGQQDTVVDFIESVSVDVERFKRVACDREVYAAGAANLWSLLVTQ